MTQSIDTNTTDTNKSQDGREQPQQQNTEKTAEIGGPKGLEPTRYGDWEKAGRCIDF